MLDFELSLCFPCSLSTIKPRLIHLLNEEHFLGNFFFLGLYVLQEKISRVFFSEKKIKFGFCGFL